MIIKNIHYTFQPAKAMISPFVFILKTLEVLETLNMLLQQLKYIITATVRNLAKLKILLA